jgi:hypothetical protein
MQMIYLVSTYLGELILIRILALTNTQNNNDNIFIHKLKYIIKDTG